MARTAPSCTSSARREWPRKGRYSTTAISQALRVDLGSPERRQESGRTAEVRGGVRRNRRRRGLGLSRLGQGGVADHSPRPSSSCQEIDRLNDDAQLLMRLQPNNALLTDAELPPI